jgi:hypothetical protein
VTVEEDVAGYVDTVRAELGPWLVRRGDATKPDRELLASFLDRAARRKRNVHLRPGLRLLRRWDLDQIGELRWRGGLANEIRSAVNQLPDAVGDPLLPAPATASPKIKQPDD